jgi:hypothetical protein
MPSWRTFHSCVGAATGFIWAVDGPYGIEYYFCSDIRFCMTLRAPGWDELRTFVEVSRDGSLSGATSMRWKRRSA